MNTADALLTVMNRLLDCCPFCQQRGQPGEAIQHRIGCRFGDYLRHLTTVEACRILGGTARSVQEVLADFGLREMGPAVEVYGLEYDGELLSAWPGPVELREEWDALAGSEAVTHDAIPEMPDEGRVLDLAGGRWSWRRYLAVPIFLSPGPSNPRPTERPSTREGAARSGSTCGNPPPAGSRQPGEGDPS